MSGDIATLIISHHNISNQSFWTFFLILETIISSGLVESQLINELQWSLFHTSQIKVIGLILSINNHLYFLCSLSKDQILISSEKDRLFIQSFQSIFTIFGCTISL